MNPPNPSPTLGQLRPTIPRLFYRQPRLAVDAGKHEFDGQLPDWSEDGLKTRNRPAARRSAIKHRPSRTTDWIIANASNATISSRKIDRDLFWLEVADQPHTSPVLLRRRIGPRRLRRSRVRAARNVASRPTRRIAKNVPRVLEQIKANLKLPLRDGRYVKIGRSTIGGLADFFANDVPGIFRRRRRRTVAGVSSKRPTTPPSAAVQRIRRLAGTNRKRGHRRVCARPREVRARC